MTVISSPGSAEVSMAFTVAATARRAAKVLIMAISSA
jgi:hypothetical protein